MPVRQYELVNDAKTPISLVFSKEARVAILQTCFGWSDSKLEAPNEIGA
jgi:hypothetical protein